MSNALKLSRTRTWTAGWAECHQHRPAGWAAFTLYHGADFGPRRQDRLMPMSQRLYSQPELLFSGAAFLAGDQARRVSAEPLSSTAHL